MEKCNRKPVEKVGTVKAVAFDLDQTLFCRTLALQALVREWAGARYSSEVWQRVQAEDRNGYGDRMQFFGWLAEELGLRWSAEEMLLRFRAELPRHISRAEESIALVCALQERGYEVAILTNGGAELQRAKLARTELDRYVPASHLLVSGEFPFQKPDPAIFGLLCDRLGLAPAEVLYVGDHYENDALGAHRAGLKAAWLRQVEGPVDMPAAIHMLEDLSEVRSLVESL